MRNLEGRDLLPSDDFYVKCLRLANLNAMAGKMYLTIVRHRREILANIARKKLIGVTPSYKPRGQSPEKDQGGMGVLEDMLLKILVAKGRIRK